MTLVNRLHSGCLKLLVSALVFLRKFKFNVFELQEKEIEGLKSDLSTRESAISEHLVKIGELNGAISRATSLSESLAAELAGVAFNFANLLAEKDRFEQALIYYQRATQLSNTALFHHYAGNLLDRLGNFKEAEAQWTKAIALESPDRLGTLSDIIMRLVFHGDRKTAQTWLKQAAEYWSNSVQEAGNRGDRRRFLRSDYTSVIGHLCLLDYYIKARELNWIDKNLEPVLVAANNKPINSSLVGYWRKYLTVIDEVEAEHDFQSIAPLQQDNIGFTVLQSQAYHYWEAWALVQAEWERRKLSPLLQLSEEHLERGRQALRSAAGIAESEWFVCLHVREPGFHADEKGLYQTTRNANILSYGSTIDAVIKRGGKVIRVGDASMSPIGRTDVFDYARSEIKSDWMDVFLAGACRLFVGTASGLAHLPPVFGVPCALTNWCPLGMRSSYGADRFIPKLIRSRRENRLLSFKEMMSAPVHHWQYKRYYDGEDLELIDNTPDDIAIFVTEMLDDPATELTHHQMRFEKLAVSDPVCYGISPIGRSFVAKYSNLLD